MTANNSSQANCSRILRFWHKVEFFIPFDLQQQVLDARDAEWSVRTFSKQKLRRSTVRDLWQPDLPERELTGFDVYVGIFDKSELADATERVIRETLTETEFYDQQERSELEGKTCHARIRLNAQGEPLLDEASVSTAPWALGRIQRHGLAGLQFDAFQTSVELLMEALRNFRAMRLTSKGETGSLSSSADGDPPSAGEKPLTAEELLALLGIFHDWSGFHPSEDLDERAAAIAIHAKSVEKRVNADEPRVPDENPTRIEEDEDREEAEQTQIDILNSFFAEDLGRAIAALDRGVDCPTLTAYLTPVPDSARIDLYHNAGRARILSALDPGNLNRGRWLDEPHHAMSLMQQFAINSAFERGEASGLFSVNGPPGTGKTTLLRDIFAENITRRARVLARFEKAGDAFLRDRAKAEFAGGQQPCWIALPRAELTGFEMVVASSNNTAVENISRDLPKTKALGKTAWRDEQGRARFTYLQPVAAKVAEQMASGEYRRLDADEEPWGLISCVLGKKANRSAFVERIGRSARSGKKMPKGFDPARHQSIWMWRDGYRGPGFAEVRRSFLKADCGVAQRTAALSRYAELRAELDGKSETDFSADALREAREAQQRMDAAQASLEAIQAESRLCANQLATLHAEERLIEKGRPGWWARLLRRPSARQYRAELAANHQSQREWLQRQRMAEETHLNAWKLAQQATADHHEAQRSLAGCRAAWRAKQQELQQLIQQFPQANKPDRADDLEQDCWQIDGLWQEETLNGLRSELFAAALGLHEAWLAEVLRKGGGFGPNVVAVCHLLSGKRLYDTRHALAIWQSLFLMVPVISSTFASVASQFRDLEQNSLGWLFIDEAGQAVPQAAVGALWRARRAVVVGDPLQIEPVFTVPIKLIKALVSSSELPPDQIVAPHQVSVQNLADEANRLGTRIGSSAGDDFRWIGSPLRVHRRCVDPMFGIANEIAYEGKMVFHNPLDIERRPPWDSLNLGPSAWVNAPGLAQSRQAVPDQIALVHKALMALYRRIGILPPIYIISPFRRIKAELIETLSNPARWSPLSSENATIPPKKNELRTWYRERVGTIHTFQGKEESIVWMVLGCDNDTVGAARWAASKPNLLNVALTRAKHRFFMIGDIKLWGGLPYFSAARNSLPVISPDEFVNRMNQAGFAGNNSAL